MLAFLFLAACSGGSSRPVATTLQGFVVADEPRAAQVGREILAQGGNAADAAVAAAFAMAVTLPSRAGLGGGGACVARNGREPTPTGGIVIGGVSRPQQQNVTTRTFQFLPLPGGGSDGAAALPMMVRGLAALHAQYGSLRWERVLVPAENFARFGVPVSRALVRDIGISGIEVTGPDGKPLKENDTLQQPELAQSITELRMRGPTDLYSGGLAAAFVDALQGAVDPRRLAATAPAMEVAKGVEIDNDRYYFSPSSGGALAAALLQTAVQDRRAGAKDAAARAAARLAAAAKSPGVGAPPSAEGAASSLVAVDERGGAVACSFTMGHLFGGKRYAGRTGILVGVPAAPGTPEGQAVVALLIGNENSNQLLGAFAAGGDASAPAALVQVVLEATAGGQKLEQAVAAPRLYPAGGALYAEAGAPAAPAAQPTTLPLGRVNAVSCPDGLPKSPDSCMVAADPRGFGLAAVASKVR